MEHLLLFLETFLVRLRLKEGAKKTTILGGTFVAAKAYFKVGEMQYGEGSKGHGDEIRTDNAH